MNIKDSLKSLKPYQVEAEFNGIRLDANETRNFLFPEGFVLNTFEFHRYPDHSAKALREALSQYVGIDANSILEGNGSSELIELMIKTYVEKDELIMSFEPTFSMYRVYSNIYGAKFLGFPLNNDYTLDVDAFIKAVQVNQPKLIFLCTPNNPTGGQLKKEEIIQIIRSTKALIVIDEAYMEFADATESMTQEVLDYQNVIVLRTFSKAFGLASIRLGYMIANETIVSTINRVKSPYHLNQVTQTIGIEALRNIKIVLNEVKDIIERRETLMKRLSSLPIVVYPSKGNFIFIQSPDKKLYQPLLNRGIRIRAYQDPVDSYRITIGTQEENDTLYQALKEIFR
jgi:histidinol-phosphate aminotransferase